MFVCGGPVYIAGVTTSAINLSLIMALSPLVVLLFSFVSGQEAVHRNQIIGMLLSLAGAALIIFRGRAPLVQAWRWGPARPDGDAGLGGIHAAAKSSGQWRQLSGADRPVRSRRRAVLAALRHPRNGGPRHQPRSADVRRWSISSQGWSQAWLPIRPMPISAASSARCRRRSASTSGPIVSAVLSMLFSWRGADHDPSDRRRTVSWAGCG